MIYSPLKNMRLLGDVLDVSCDYCAYVEFGRVNGTAFTEVSNYGIIKCKKEVLGREIKSKDL